MSMAHEPAFPVPMAPNGCGMSYRQWLIGKIAEGWASDAPQLKSFEAPDEAFRDAARACIRLADAVIAEQDAEGGK